MKQKTAKELEQLIKELNKKNEVHEKHLSYICKVNRFMRGGYDVLIEYKVFFSTDFEKLMKFVSANNISFFLGSYSGENERSAYLSIQ